MGPNHAYRLVCIILLDVMKVHKTASSLKYDDLGLSSTTNNHYGNLSNIIMDQNAYRSNRSLRGSSRSEGTLNIGDTARHLHSKDFYSYYGHRPDYSSNSNSSKNYPKDYYDYTSNSYSSKYHSNNDYNDDLVVNEYFDDIYQSHFSHYSNTHKSYSDDSFSSVDYSLQDKKFVWYEDDVYWYDYFLIIPYLFVVAFIRFLLELALNGCFACCACIAELCCGTGLIESGNITRSNHNQGSGCQNYHADHSNILDDNLKYNDEEFEKLVQSTKNEVENKTCIYHEQIITSHPYSGVYIASFFDPNSRTRHEAMLNLNFTREFHNGHGYRISGQRSDKNGETIIEDGFVTYDGNAAWWRERTVTGEIGLQVMSRGRFDFRRGTFYDVWSKNTQIFGSYISFCASTSDGVPNANAIPVIMSSELENDTQVVTGYWIA